MKSAFIFPLAVAVFLLNGGSALAQDRGQVGLTMGFPTSIGLIWHPTDRVALRPEFSISGISTEQTVTISPIQSDTESSLYNIGISGLFYVSRSDNLRTYVSPRLAYGRASSTIDNALTGPSESITKTTSVSGAFGAQYALHRRFGVFGEVGLGYSGSTSRSEVGIAGEIRVDSDAWSTRGGVGVILYFK